MRSGPLKAVERFCDPSHGAESRSLFLVDILGQCLSFAWKRSSNFVVLSLFRRVCALCPSRNVFTVFRWIPSEFSADEGSKRFDTSVGRSLTQLLSQFNFGQFDKRDKDKP